MMSRFTVDIFAALDPADPIHHEVGSGDTILSVLEHFAAIAWENPPDVLLKTVVWVRDERGMIVATGHYRQLGGPDTAIQTFLEFHVPGKPIDLAYPSIDMVYRFGQHPLDPEKFLVNLGCVDWSGR